MSPYVYKTAPFNHQVEALRASWNQPAFALLMEMGTGKSKVLIDTIACLYELERIDCALILAPKGVYLNWVDLEIPAHLPERIPTQVTYWRSGKKAPVIDPTMKKLRILVMNIEALSTREEDTEAEKYARRFLKSGRALLGIDESTAIKRTKSNRTKAVLRLREFAPFRRILTGLPITQSPLDLYSQYAFLDPRILGHNSYFSFRNRYAITRPIKVGPRTIKTVVGFRQLDRLSNRIKASSFRVKKEDCLDLPEKNYHRRVLEMTEGQRAVYEGMRKKALLELSETEAVTAPLVITQLLRLHQISCGFVQSDEGTVFPLPHTRTKALLEVLEETEGKAVIWATYKPSIAELELELGRTFGRDTVVSYHGDTTVQERRDAMKTFEAPSGPRFLVGTPSTGGKGITLVAANTVLYFSNSYSLEDRLQSEDRAHRIGQTRTVTYVDFVMNGTNDNKILKALLAKREVGAEVLRDGWRAWF